MERPLLAGPTLPRAAAHLRTQLAVSAGASRRGASAGGSLSAGNQPRHPALDLTNPLNLFLPRLGAGNGSLALTWLGRRRPRFPPPPPPTPPSLSLAVAVVAAWLSPEIQLQEGLRLGFANFTARSRIRLKFESEKETFLTLPGSFSELSHPPSET